MWWKRKRKYFQKKVTAVKTKPEKPEAHPSLHAWWWVQSGSSGCPVEPVHWATQCLYVGKNKKLLKIYHSHWMIVKESNLRIFLSSRPGRSRAGSKVSGRLVAMIILTLCRVSNPSIWFNSWQTEIFAPISFFFLLVHWYIGRFQFK